tara:strand:- start:1824 stop:2081 length:258 start_codon:yes stop_codon:yes gene_type:complete
MKKNNKKHYAYGSMVRKPMQMGGDMMMSANPMAPRQQKGMQQGMMYGGTMKKKMAKGKMVGDLDKDGKMSGYEKKRQAAIEKNMG